LHSRGVVVSTQPAALFQCCRGLAPSLNWPRAAERSMRERDFRLGSGRLPSDGAEVATMAGSTTTGADLSAAAILDESRWDQPTGVLRWQLLFPTNILHARKIPGSNKVLAVVTGHHRPAQGKLAVIDPAVAVKRVSVFSSTSCITCGASTSRTPMSF